jgi:hypothetical protein
MPDMAHSFWRLVGQAQNMNDDNRQRRPKGMEGRDREARWLLAVIAALVALLAIMLTRRYVQMP